MDHIKALLIKFIMCTAILWIVLGGFYGVSLFNILTVSVLLTGVSYVIGDLFVLSRFENWGATIADFGLTFFGIWVLGSFLFAPNIPLVTASFISALFISIGEVFFHRYMAIHVLERPDTVGRKDSLGHLQTEFSEEMDGKEDN